MYEYFLTFIDDHNHVLGYLLEKRNLKQPMFHIFNRMVQNWFQVELQVFRTGN